MIGINILSLINNRLRAIFPGYSDTPFSRINVLLYKDFF
jgi:hypothetical protein